MSINFWRVKKWLTDRTGYKQLPINGDVISIIQSRLEVKLKSPPSHRYAAQITIPQAEVAPAQFKLSPSAPFTVGDITVDEQLTVNMRVGIPSYFSGDIENSLSATFGVSLTIQGAAFVTEMFEELPFIISSAKTAASLHIRAEERWNVSVAGNVLVHTGQAFTLEYLEQNLSVAPAQFKLSTGAAFMMKHLDYTLAVDIAEVKLGSGLKISSPVEIDEQVDVLVTLLLNVLYVMMDARHTVNLEIYSTVAASMPHGIESPHELSTYATVKLVNISYFAASSTVSVIIGGKFDFVPPLRFAASGNGQAEGEAAFAILNGTRLAGQVSCAAEVSAALSMFRSATLYGLHNDTLYGMNEQSLYSLSFIEITA